MTRDSDAFTDEIRRAARGHSPLPGPGFEDRLLAALIAPAHAPERRIGRLPALASAVLAVLVVSALLWSSPGFRARVASLTPAGPAPVVPASTPDPGAAATFLYQAVKPEVITTGAGPVKVNHATTGTINRADWTGAARGSVAPPANPDVDTVGSGIAPSPDGHYLMTRAGDGVSIVDDRGAPVAGDPTLLGYWADDSRHLCLLSGGVLQMADIVPGHAVTRSTVRLQTTPYLYLGLLSCSPARDLAVIDGQTGSARLGKSAIAAAVQLSTGRITPLDLPPGVRVTNPVASPDGHYVAVTTVGTAPQCFILDVDQNAVAARCAGAAIGFSGNGRLLVMNAGSTATVMDWRTGRTVWHEHGASVGAYVGVQALPGGEDLALDVDRGAAADIVLVRADGSARTIAHNAELVSTAGFSPPLG